MEDKRSIHSIHSYRSNRGLARPISDISFIDEETLSPSSAASRAIAARQSSNGGTGLAPTRGSTHGMNNYARKSVGSISAGGGALSVTVPSSTNIPSTNNSAFREGGNRNTSTYRGSNATNTNNSTIQATSTNAAVGSSMVHHQRITEPKSSKYCSDAQTQSAESSFAVAEAEAAALAEAANFDGGGYSSTNNNPSYPVPPNTEIIPPRDQAASRPVCVQVGVPSRGASPSLLGPPSPQPHGLLAPYAPATHLIPSPLYPAPGFGYDPSYCQLLGQAADGYQYELVRRPSVGPPELSIPGLDPMLQRRLSGGVPAMQQTAPPAAVGGGSISAGTYPPQSHSPVPPGYSGLAPLSAATAPHLATANLSSMPGSFDSTAGPPQPSPIFIQSSHSQARQAPLAQPVSTSQRHFHSLAPVTTIYSSSSISAPQPQYTAVGGVPPSSMLHHRSSNVSPSPILGTDWGASNVNSTSPGDMPKLIHETSI